MEPRLQAALQRAAFKGLFTEFIVAVGDNPDFVGWFWELGDTEYRARDGLWKIGVGAASNPFFAFTEVQVDWRLSLSRRRGSLSFTTEGPALQYWRWFARDWDKSGLTLGHNDPAEPPLPQEVFETTWLAAHDALRRFLKHYGLGLSSQAKAMFAAK